jgi:predicted deacylase
VQVKHATATLTDGTEVRIPYWHVTSGTEGPVFLITCAQHGNEVNGAEAMRRVIRIAQANLLKGEIFGVPMVNLVAVRKRRPHISSAPEKPYGDDEGHNMNRTWPGNPEGNDTERLSHAVHEACVTGATHCLDLHSWSRFSGTGCIFRPDCEESAQMARVSAIRFLHPRAGSKTPGAPCTIGALFNDAGRGAVTIELATQYTIVEREVQRGVRAALNLGRWLGLLPGEPEGLEEPQVDLDQAKVVKVTAPRAGLFVEAGLATWDYVEEGARLGHILEDEGLETVEILAPVSGYLQTYGGHRANCDVALPDQHPYVEVGDTVAAVAEGGVVS